MKINHIITDNTVTVNFDGKTKVFHKGSEEFSLLILAIKEGRFDDVPSIACPEDRVATFSEGFIEVRDGVIHIDGEPVPSGLSDRILRFEAQGLPYLPLVNFARNLRENTSYQTTQALFRFLESHHYPITDDGHFIAYKGVRTDFTDCYSGTIDNSVGKVVQMRRNLVNEDQSQTCSYGLHVSDYAYAHGGYGGGARGVTVEVKVHPRDVVAVPHEYGNSKMRVCRYEVVGVSVGEHDEELLRDDSYEDADDDASVYMEVQLPPTPVSQLPATPEY